MKKTYMLIAAVLVSGGMTIGASYADGAKSTERAAAKAAWKATLTEDQKSCLESHGCPRIAKDEKANMTAEELASTRQCKRDAFTACGIDMPERADRKAK